jgi:hypothetical protein
MMQWMLVLIVMSVSHLGDPDTSRGHARWMRVTPMPELTYNTEAECQQYGNRIKGLTVKDESRIYFDYKCQPINTSK